MLQNWLSEPKYLFCPIRVEETKLKGRKILVYAGNMGLVQGFGIILELAQILRIRDDIGFFYWSWKRFNTFKKNGWTFGA